MIKISNKLAQYMIVEGQDKGFSLGYVNGDKSIKYTLYVRVVDGDEYIIAENGKLDEYAVLEPIDTFEKDTEYAEIMSGLKDTLNDLLKLLQDEKKEKGVK